MMKTRLQHWFRRLFSHGPEEKGYQMDLLIPVSQLYGIEFHPSLSRYHER
ncbi:hypothetical protein [Pantoea eucrina]|uniref:Uncharacterized protein n=1 Tax=Pantoea eucrina TaxID=472693 RepID=A0ABU5LEB2_9GAMM|nr:hypothetical protein [Pantoea eucrina]MDZ7278031.1 hypothetical protein [Pantoea eucrina]